jgi:hypothetical protein
MLENIKKKRLGKRGYTESTSVREREPQAESSFRNSGCGGSFGAGAVKEE